MKIEQNQKKEMEILKSKPLTKRLEETRNERTMKKYETVVERWDNYKSRI